MKSFLVSLCAGWLFCTALACRAQQPPPAAGAAPILYVYAVKYGENALARIVLGLEKPAVKISAFAQCKQVSAANPKLFGLAVQLTPDDLKALITAMKTVADFKADETPAVVLWIVTPDNKALDFVSLPTSNAGGNLLQAGVLHFDSDSNSSTVNYLMEKLHPQ